MISFYMPTKLLVGKEVVLENADIFCGFGKKAFIITGKSSKINGSLRDVEKVLTEQNIDWCIFDKTEENPSINSVVEGAELGLKENVDFIVAIGGGSPIDSAKAIGVLIKNALAGKVDEKVLFDGSQKALESIPLISIPTTAGTGTEATPYAIFTDHEAETKKNFAQRIFPEVSFLDVRYFETMPEQGTIDTAVDALTHLVEGYLGRRANILSNYIAEFGIKLWGETLESFKSRNFSSEVREKLMFASTLGGMVISQTGTSLPHGMGYGLTYHLDVKHGKANGLTLPAYMAFHDDKQKVNKVLELLGLDTVDELQDLMKELLGTCPLTEELIDRFSEELFTNKAKLANHPGEVTLEDIKNIYRKAL